MRKLDPVWIVARLENNHTAVALRFLELNNFTFYAPRARVITPHSTRTPLLFPSYIFVQMVDGQWGPIRRTIGVQSVVLRGNSPAIVPHQIITALKKRERKGLIDVAPRLRRGMRVQINYGPLEHYEGMLTTDPSARVRVLFDSILGAPREISILHSAITPV